MESLMGDSVLLSSETKAALLQYIQIQGDPTETARITHFLKQEKIFIIEFMKRRPHEGSFPEKTSVLLSEMRMKFLKDIRLREESEKTKEYLDPLLSLSLVF